MCWQNNVYYGCRDPYRSGRLHWNGWICRRSLLVLWQFFSQEGKLLFRSLPHLYLPSAKTPIQFLLPPVLIIAELLPLFNIHAQQLHVSFIFEKKVGIHVLVLSYQWPLLHTAGLLKSFHLACDRHGLARRVSIVRAMWRSLGSEHGWGPVQYWWLNLTIWYQGWTSDCAGVDPPPLPKVGESDSEEDTCWSGGKQAALINTSIDVTSLWWWPVKLNQPLHVLIKWLIIPGGYSPKIWVGVWGLLLEALMLFQT